MKATVYYVASHKTSRDERSDALSGKMLSPDKYAKVAEVELPSCFTPREGPPDWRLSVCEVLFERFNVGDHGGENIRSMSVGDIIVLEGQPGLFFCDTVGFRPVEWIMS